MEILRVYCPCDCDHIESDTSLAAAKRRLRAHIRDAHNGAVLTEQDIADGEVEGVPA